MSADTNCELGTKIRQVSKKCGFVFGVFFLYLLLGTFTFKFLEEENREDYVEEASEEIEENRAELLKALWAETIAKSEEDWALIANERIDLYEQSLKDYILHGVDLQDEERNNPWSFVGSMFYCFTLLTTIGYGNIFPTTSAGKILTILYGLIGIPLTLFCMAEIGKLLTLVLKWLLRKRWTTYDSSEDFNFRPILGVGVTCVYLLLGVALFDFWEEDWDLLDASYFSFVTFSTVGFGDVLPSDQGYMLLLMIYSLSALSMSAMCFTLIQASLENFLNAKQDQLARWWTNRKQRIADASRKKNEDSTKDDTVRYVPPSSGSGFHNDFSGFVSTEMEEEEEIEADEVEEEEEN